MKEIELIEIKKSKRNSVYVVMLVMAVNESAPSELLALFSTYSFTSESILSNRQIAFEEFVTDFVGTQKTYKGIITEDKISKITQFL